jgi:hypothetical protein
MIWIRALAIGGVCGMVMSVIWGIQDTFGFGIGYLIGIFLIMSGFLILVDRLTQ